MSDEDIKLDLMRAKRTGLGEAVLCEQKTVDQIVRILMQAQEQGFPLLLTRLSEHKYDLFSSTIRENLNYDKVSATGFFNHESNVASTTSSVAVVAAGTSDMGPASEAIRTLEFNAVKATAIVDIGVAGLWRLMERLEEIRNHDIIIVFAGMDAALVSVLGGLVNKPVIAVPTSTGYGAARKGETALAACLVSCAPGITVCNIDNGYGAACAALRILNSTRSQT
jgi:pyridinium-3,5-biscarboxylic acid mononucleotide synthase